MYRVLLLAPLLLVAFFPDSAAAQLVTCDGVSAAGQRCGTCEFAQMVKNVFGFLITLASIIATITLVYVGIRLNTSGGNEQVKGEVKQALWNIVIGLFLIIAAFAIVDAIMRALVTDGSLLNWDQVECIYAKNPTDTRVDIEVPNISFDRTAVVDCGANGCADEVATCQSVDGAKASVDSSSNQVSCTTSVAGSVTEGGRGVAQCDEDNPNCSIEMLRALGLTEAQANVMSCIAVTENAGGAVGCSGTGPCGTFQITKTNWRDYTNGKHGSIPGCTEEDFGGSIVAAQNNGSCNAKVMARMVQDSGYQPWTGCCDARGKPWNTNARSCVKNYSLNDSTPRGW